MSLVNTGTQRAFEPDMLEMALGTTVQWVKAGDPEMPWRTRVPRVTGVTAEWQLRLNDFPAEALYTLLIDGVPIGEVDDWPSCWRKSK